MEHLPEESVDQVLDTVRTHLKKDGIFVASIATFHIPNSNHHQCVKQKPWWYEKLRTHDLFPIEDQEIFQLSDFPRGGSNHDWLLSEGKGFHVVCFGRDNF